MVEEKNDLKGEEKNSTGADQTGVTGSDEGATGASGASGATGPSGPSGDQVMISKSELEQLRKDAAEKENYRKGIIRLNRARGRNLPGSEPVKKKKPVEGEEGFDDNKLDIDKFVTKEELTLREEKRAITEACKNDEIALNWDDIIVFYQRPQENTYDTQLDAIHTAHKKWRADKGLKNEPGKTEEEKKAEKAKADLASEKGLNKGKEKKPAKPGKKIIIPKKEKMTDWYGKEEK